MGGGPRRHWWGLSWGEQREVLRLARRREVHPDPAIRDAARRWAEETRSDSLPLTTLEGLFDSGMSWAERRAAHRILRAECAAATDDLLTPEDP